MSNRENAYAEVYTILQDLNEEEYNKIPQEIVETIKQNKNDDYYFELDEDLELKEQTLLPETKAILFNLFRDYLSTPEQKKKIIQMQNEERIKLEEEKREKYNSDNIFKDRNNSNVQMEEQSLIVVKDKRFIDKIFNFFNNLLKKLK